MLPTPQDAPYKIAQRRGPRDRMRTPTFGNRAERRKRPGNKHAYKATFTGTSVTRTETRRKSPRSKFTVQVLVHENLETKPRELRGRYTQPAPWITKARRRQANRIARASRKAHR